LWTSTAKSTYTKSNAIFRIARGRY